jgi:hypothetical protein
MDSTMIAALTVSVYLATLAHAGIVVALIAAWSRSEG